MAEDYSLVLGGPLYQFYLRTRLARPPIGLLRRRLIAFPLVTWLPVLILSCLSGTAWSGVDVPFFHDIGTHVRFLIALPLFIAAECFVHDRLHPMLQQFLVRDIILPADRAKFEEALASSLRWRNSVVAEILLLIFALTIGHQLWVKATSVQAASWIGMRTASGLDLTPAGIWFAWVSMPIFQFIFLRWYYRWMIWVRFLWQVSRLPLRLYPMHPDRCGGLGFLAFAVPTFTPIILAESVVLAGLVAGKIFFEGAILTSFKLDILGSLAFLGAFVLGPLCLFSPHLVKAKRKGLRQYGVLANQYVKAFDHKWNREEGKPDKELLGSGDIQSLADMGNSFQVVRGMYPVPFGKEALIQVVVVVLAPFLPLVLTLIPLEKLITKLLGIPF